MTKQPRFPHEEVFCEMVFSDLKLAKVRSEQRQAILRATVSTTIAFVRNNRRRALGRNPSAQQLAKLEFDFETNLLRSVAAPPSRDRKRGRKTDPETVRKFLEILKMFVPGIFGPGMNWTEIEAALVPKFGAAAPGTYKRLFRRLLPTYLKVLRKQFLPDISEEQFLSLALPAAKRRPGRLKSRQNSSK